MTGAIDEQLRAHLVRDDGQEDLCFALTYPSRGERRQTTLIAEVILPRDGERRVHGNASFLPQYFERALGLALSNDAGLAFLHAHPGTGWQGMSRDDAEAERGMAAGVFAATGQPLAGLTLSAKDGFWSARVWERDGDGAFVRQDCVSVRVVGSKLMVAWHPRLRPAPRRTESLRRTIDAWGAPAQADLARLRIGVIGAGSVGIPVAEALARSGVERVVAIDFDIVKEHNLDRLLHASAEHALARTPKVDLLKAALPTAATAEHFDLDARPISVCDEAGYRAALDCDVLFSCVDRPWPRSVLNHIAYAHCIPVVDGGISVSRLPDGRLRSADWRAHVAAHDRRCLECLGQFDRGWVQADREGRLDDPRYIEALPTDHPLRASENVFIFSLAAAASELMQFLLLVLAPAGIADVGAISASLPALRVERDTRSCEPWCLSPTLEARGDRAGHPGTRVPD
ncbi:MAG: ThiF family adenylyltransferase [Chloroflexota bacterium]